jgi:hypothetical protein
MVQVRQHKLSKNELERQRECTLLSVLVSNHLHDERFLDPTASADEIGPLKIGATLDGDIPVRITVKKRSYGPAWIEWRLWPTEPGRSTWGTMTIFRATTAKAFLQVATYDRARKRSPRLAEISIPDAKWGLSSPFFGEFGIVTTY